MKLTFLSALMPLVKSFTLLKSGEIEKSDYPKAKLVTSHQHEVNKPVELFNLLHKQAFDPKAPCLLTGHPDSPLENESRQSRVPSEQPTQLLTFDLDDAPFTSPAEFMKAIGWDNLTYTWQWSSSAKLDPKNKRISGHIFIMLDKPLKPGIIKAWLMHLNLTTEVLKKNLTLTSGKQALHWPLDIVVNDSARIIYIATPKFIGVKNPIPDKERIQFVKGSIDMLPTTQLPQLAIEPLKKDAKAILNELRKKEGFEAITAKTKIVQDFEVQMGVGQATHYEYKDCDEYIRYNLNDGRSWAYWHPKGNFEYLHSWKNEPSMLLKEVLPERYKELKALQNDTSQTKSESGDLVLCFREKKTAEYFKGLYNPEKNMLDIHKVKSKDQLIDYYLSHNIAPPSFIQEYEMIFDPTTTQIVDEAERTINRFIEPPALRNPQKGNYPTIQKALDSAVGTGEVQEHFLNWLACIFQYRMKTHTAWILHGTQGCLAPETEIMFRRGKRNGGRVLTIKQAYEKWTGQFKQGTGLGKTWDMSLPTFAHSVKDNLTIGYHEVFKILEAGMKTLYRVTTDDGESIRITHEHPFMRPDGSFTKLCELTIGDEILKKGSALTHITKPKGRNKKRITIHSIPNHPTAWQHIINGKNYKRNHKARLVYEAEMNGLDYDMFIDILRTQPDVAATLEYLPQNVVIHHRDEDCANDKPSNLVLIDKQNHDAHHAKETGLGTISTRIAKIVSIKQDATEMTYDMVMKAPYHNYVANNFCVSNTGKGVLFEHVIQPLLTEIYSTQILANRIKSDFSGWQENKLIVMIDEIEVDLFENKSVVESFLKDTIVSIRDKIHRKGVDEYYVKSFINLIFGSNKNQPVKIPRDDRRFNVAKYQPTRWLPTTEEIEVKLPKEREHFAHYLMNRTACKDTARQILQSADRDAIQSIGMTSIEEFAHNITSGNLEALMEFMPDEKVMNEHQIVDPIAAAYSSIMKRCLVENESKLSRDELSLLFKHAVGERSVPDGANKFTSFLRHNGIVTERFRERGLLIFGIKIEWKLDPAVRKELLQNLSDKPSKLRRVS